MCFGEVVYLRTGESASEKSHRKSQRLLPKQPMPAGEVYDGLRYLPDMNLIENRVRPVAVGRLCGVQHKNAKIMFTATTRQLSTCL